jgi:alpha-D-ribose 1-methylphosphonate 5-triphosphate synthase subunit PhnG
MYRARARLLLCRAMLCYAVLCARLKQGLRFAVLCDAMLCYAKARARLCRDYSIGCTGVQTHPQLQATAIGS